MDHEITDFGYESSGCAWPSTENEGGKDHAMQGDAQRHFLQKDVS